MAPPRWSGDTKGLGLVLGQYRHSETNEQGTRQGAGVECAPHALLFALQQVLSDEDDKAMGKAPESRTQLTVKYCSSEPL